MIEVTELKDFIKEPGKDLSDLKESLDEKEFVRQKIENANFNQSPWNERFDMFRKHTKLLKPPKKNRDYQAEKNILWLMQKVDQEILLAYHEKEDAKFKSLFYNKINNTISSIISSAKFESGIPLNTYKSVAEIIQFAREVEESNKRNQTIQDIANKTHSLDARLYQMYKNLLLEDRNDIWKFEIEVINIMNPNNTDADVIQHDNRSEILNVLNTKNKKPLTLYNDRSKCLWIARFMKNFELCYNISFGRFYFDEDNKKSVHAGIDKTRKIIERSTLKKDIKDIRAKL